MVVPDTMVVWTRENATQTEPRVFIEEIALDVTGRDTKEDILGAQEYLLEYYHTTVAWSSKINDPVRLSS